MMLLFRISAQLIVDLIYLFAITPLITGPSNTNKERKK